MTTQKPHITVPNIMAHYYDIKYPYLHYSYRDDDGGYIMFSVPPSMLADTYEAHFGHKPKTFFDCGAATGMIIRLALDYGMDAHGIDIRKYPEQIQSVLYNNGKTYICPGYIFRKIFESNRIIIKSILDCEPINADIAYCNGTLTYFDDKTLPNVLSKFKKVNMLCAIHNTTEDINAAAKMGQKLLTCNKPRNIKPNDWWLETFDKNGFKANLNDKLGAFIAIPHQR